MTPQLRNLAFGGTGVRNAAYAGALLALQEKDLYKDITGFAGTSAGSIVAALAGVGYTPDEVVEKIVSLDFKRIPGGSVLFGPLRLLAKFGWYNADYLIAQLSEMIAEKMGDGMVDIESVERKTGHRIRIVGTNLSRRSAWVFPSAQAHGVPLVEAVRVSMSIPLFFEAQRLERDVLVDGGVLWNLPVEVFDADGTPDAGTLGIIVREPNDVKPQRIRRPHDYVDAMLRTLVRAQEGNLDYRPTALGRVIEVDDLGISPVDFFISNAQKWALIEAGRVATNAWLDRRAGKTLPTHAAPRIAKGAAA